MEFTTALTGLMRLKSGLRDSVTLTLTNLISGSNRDASASRRCSTPGPQARAGRPMPGMIRVEEGSERRNRSAGVLSSSYPRRLRGRHATRMTPQTAYWIKNMSILLIASADRSKAALLLGVLSLVLLAGSGCGPDSIAFQSYQDTRIVSDLRAAGKIDASTSNGLLKTDARIDPYR